MASKNISQCASAKPTMKLCFAEKSVALKKHSEYQLFHSLLPCFLEALQCHLIPAIRNWLIRVI